jgi:uncharacterized protein (TIGR00369 family)
MPMPNFVAVDPDFESRIRASFGAQQVMQTLGASLVHIRPGEVRIELPFSPALGQQHGFLHAGVLGILVDSACGYAAYTLMPAGTEVLSVEYKINFLSPARGRLFGAVGRVVKPGRTLTVCAGEAWAHADAEPKLVAAMQATMICVPKSQPAGPVIDSGG